MQGRTNGKKRGRMSEEEARNMTEVKKKGDGIKRMRKEENKGEELR